MSYSNLQPEKRGHQHGVPLSRHIFFVLVDSRREKSDLMRRQRASSIQNSIPVRIKL